MINQFVSFAILLGALAFPKAEAPNEEEDLWLGQYETFFRQDTLVFSLELELKSRSRAVIASFDWSLNKLVKQKGRWSIDPSNPEIITIKVKDWEQSISRKDSSFLADIKANGWPDLEWKRIGQNPNINNRQWDLVLMEGYSRVHRSGNPLTFFIDSSGVSFGGYSGCNSYGGVLEYEDQSETLFIIKETYSTLLACEPPGPEEQYHSLLHQARSFKMKDNIALILKDANGNPLLFFQRHSLLDA